MHAYSALGLDVRSDVELPALPSPGEALTQPPLGGLGLCTIEELAADQHSIDWAGLVNLDVSLPTANHAWTPLPGIYQTADGWLYRAFFEGSFAEVLVSAAGSRVTWVCSGDVTEHDLASLLSGVMLSAAATAAGELVLHGSVVEIGGKSIALLAASGTGKSTTAMSLIEAGAKLVSEDAFTARCDEDQARVLPGARAIRLEDATLRAFGYDPMQFPLVHLASDKRLLQPPRSSLASPQFHTPVLTAIWCVERAEVGQEPGVEPLGASASLKAIQSLMHPQWMYRKPSRRVFDLQLRLLQRVPMFRLRVPATIQELRSFARTLVESA